MKYLIIKKREEGDYGLVESSKDDFINYWKLFYMGTTYENKFYNQFVNIKNRITNNDIRLAMAWKKGWIGDKEKDYEIFGSWTRSVENIIENLDYINNIKLSKEKINLEDYLTFLNNSNIFKNTIRMKTFVCHITKPLIWPILDRFVWIATCVIQGEEVNILKEPTKKDHYFDYIDFFNELASGRRSVLTRKQVDEALMAYGQFISSHRKLFM